jgi:glutathione S-transferase
MSWKTGMGCSQIPEWGAIAITARKAAVPRDLEIHAVHLHQSAGLREMAAIIKYIAKTIVPVAGLIAAEHYVLRDKLPHLYGVSKAFSATLGLPRAYSAVLVVNLIASSFLLIFLGTRVGAARTAFKEKALKDGDKDAEDRYSYPKMYAEGFSQNAKLFNCVQRGHQQALETYAQFLALSLVGGYEYPITTTVAGILWFAARLLWAEGYKTGDPSKRYQSWVAGGVWTSLILVMTTTLCTAVSIAL